MWLLFHVLEYPTVDRRLTLSSYVMGSRSHNQVSLTLTNKQLIYFIDLLYNSRWLDWNNFCNIINQYNTGHRLKEFRNYFISSGWNKSLGMAQTVCQ